MSCPGGEVVPTTTTDNVALRATIVCLHNQVRSAHGLAPLRENSRLRRAAAAHTTDMVAKGYFAHSEPSGDTLVDRLVGARYMRRSSDWTVGENLAWGTGNLATPAAIMKAWMASPGHRDNLLRRSYRELGIGIAAGVPPDPTVGSTYAADFGVRRATHAENR